MAWRRRSPLCLASRRIRYIVEIEQWYRPSSSSRAQICAGARSRYPALPSTLRISARSSGVYAVEGVGRGRGAGAGFGFRCR